MTEALDALVGCHVVRLDFDHRVSLHLREAGGRLATLVIEGAMVLRTGDASFDVDPATGLNYPACVRLLHTRIRTISATPAPERRLAVGFDLGLTLTVPHDPGYEAWEITGPA